MNKNYGLVALLAFGVNGCCKKEIMEEPQTVLQETKPEESKKEEKLALFPGIYTGTINFNGKELQVTYGVSDLKVNPQGSQQNCSLVLYKFASIRRNDKECHGKVYSLEIVDEKCDGKAESLALFSQYSCRSYVSRFFDNEVELNQQRLKGTAYGSLAARLLAAGKEVTKEENCKEYKGRQEGLEILNELLRPLAN